MDSFLKQMPYLLLLLTLFGGCTSQRVYLCSDGKAVSSPDLCSGTTTLQTTSTESITTTTIYIPEYKCRVDMNNGACEDEKGVYYVTGICDNDVRQILYWVCDADGFYCVARASVKADCKSAGKICIKTPELDPDLKSSYLNLVKCADKAKDESWTPGRYISIMGK